MSRFRFPPAYIWYLAVAAGIGGLIGSFIGSKKLSTELITNVLAIIMLVAAIQLVAVPIIQLLK